MRDDIITNLSDQDPPEKNLATILRAWLNNPDLNPCWANLVKALRCITVDESALANDIIQNFLGMLYEKQ